MGDYQVSLSDPRHVQHGLGGPADTLVRHTDLAIESPADKSESVNF